MSVNGKTCWSRKGLHYSAGKSQCGHFGTLQEERFPVSCAVKLSGAGLRPLTVRVWTTLDQGTNDESFGIDNVVIQQLKPSSITEQFNDPSDFLGWNCGKIQKCGQWGNICGGYGVKGKGADIKKTYQLPAGTYSLKMQFIKIDSWLVIWLLVCTLRESSWLVVCREHRYDSGQTNAVGETCALLQHFGFSPHLRDHENAYVSVNGKTCWSKNGIVLTKGAAVCGGGFKSEERFPVSCKVTLSGSGDRPLAVRVWSTLNQGANDESFAIDNVVIRKLKTPGAF